MYVQNKKGAMVERHCYIGNIMTNSEFVEKRIKQQIEGTYILMETLLDDPQEAAEQGLFTYSNGLGSGYGWHRFETTQFMGCIKLPYIINGVQVFGLLIRPAN